MITLRSLSPSRSWDFLSLAVATLLAGSLPTLGANWPSWRGPNQNGESSESKFPLEWSKTKNVRWRVPLPDRGNSTPVVWGDRIFVTQALEKEKQRTLICFDRKSGALLWQKGTRYEGEEKTHPDNPYCAASPVTDGKIVIATFGSAGVFAYDFSGQELWHVDLGKQQHDWGYSSSPIIDGDRCFVFNGPGPLSSLTALSLSRGETLWRNALPEPVPTQRWDGFKGELPGRIGAFGSPVVVKVGGRPELIMGLPEEVRAMDPKTGALLWKTDGPNPLVYTTPVWSENTLVVLGGYFGTGLALKLDGKGDQTARRLWFEQRAKKNRIGSPVIHDGHLYVMNMDGIAECLTLATGTVVWTERLKGPGPKADSWSSFTLAGDKLYTVNQSGDAFVVRASPKFELLAINSVGEFTNSSFAHSDGELFLRTFQALWCIAGDSQRADR